MQNMDCVINKCTNISTLLLNKEMLHEVMMRILCCFSGSAGARLNLM